MAAPQTKRIALREEDARMPKKPLRVDRAKGVVYDVWVQGLTSKNKRRKYREDGLDVALYEGAFVNFDHEGASPEDIDKPRPFGARFGQLTGVHKIAGKGLFAKELRYNTDHKNAAQFAWFCENMPHAIGLSPSQYGDVFETDQGEVVQRVTDVKGVEVVADPATTTAIYEAVCGPDGKEKPMAEDRDTGGHGYEDGDDEERKGMFAAMRKRGDPIVEADEEDPLDPTGLQEDDMGADLPADGSPTFSEEDDPSEEMYTAIDKIVRSDIDIKAKIRKITAVLKTHEGVMAEAVQPITPTDLAHAKRLLKSKGLKKIGLTEAARMVVGKLDDFETQARFTERKTKVMALIEAAKLPKEAITEHFVETLMECPNDRRIQACIDDRRTLVGTRSDRRPRSAGQTPLTEAEINDIKNGRNGTNPTTGKPLTEAEQTAEYEKGLEQMRASILDRARQGGRD